MTESEWLASTDPQRMLEALPRRNYIPKVERPPWPATVSDRKLRLFACACCRAHHYEGGPSSTRSAVVEMAEELADGVRAEQLASRWNQLPAIARCEGWLMLPAVEAPTNWATLGKECGEAATQAALLRDICGNPWRPVTLCGMSRKPFHNQFAHVDVNGGFWLENECPACNKIRVPRVLALAQAAYQERPQVCYGCNQPWNEHTHDRCIGGATVGDGHLDPQRLAVLSDALEEAGCDDETLLRHLRGEELVPRLNTGNPPLRFYEPIRSPHVRGCWAVDLVLGKA